MFGAIVTLIVELADEEPDHKQGGHGTGKTGNLVLFQDRENTGNFTLTQGKILRHRENSFL